MLNNNNTLRENNTVLYFVPEATSGIMSSNVDLGFNSCHLCPVIKASITQHILYVTVNTFYALLLFTLHTMPRLFWCLLVSLITPPRYLFTKGGQGNVLPGFYSTLR